MSKYSRQEVLHFLNEKTINYKEIIVDRESFPPPDNFWTEKNIRRCKNLFFRDNHGKNHFLVVFDYYKKLDIKKLSEIVGRGSLSFASGWRLEKYLDLNPGFLSVFGILNDEDNHVKVILDKELMTDTLLSFLPNTQGGSFIALSYSDLYQFITIVGNEIMEGDI